jgi:hypothetical protein
MTNYGSPFLRDALRGLQIPVKPRVFVSYHHANDQRYADRFTSVFHEQYEAVTDRSLDEPLDSQNPDYIYQQIRDNYISGTSCTVVLCGAQSMNRKFIDWEIKATLDKRHGLLGVALPTASRNMNGNIIVPDRLHANIQSGYAHWIGWTENAQEMLNAINAAREKAKSTWLINNSAPMKSRNS